MLRTGFITRSRGRNEPPCAGYETVPSQRLLVLPGVLILLLASMAFASGQEAPAGDAKPLWYRILVAEDLRAVTPAELAPIFEGLGAADPQITRMAVRALG